MADLSDSYIQKTQATTTQIDASEMEAWNAALAAGKPPMEITVIGDQNTPVSDDPSKHDSGKYDPGIPIPSKYDPRRPTDDELGRQLVPEGAKQSTAGKVMDNAAEVLPGAVKGVHDALYQATAFVEPLANWLNKNVADLGKYEVADPKTPAGQISKSVAQFLTGFVPAVKGLKAIGIAGKVVNPLLAGAISDFATRSGNDGRLADLWNKLGLPKNELTDWLSSEEPGLSTLVDGKPVKKDDSELMGRFKNALEGAGLGLLTEGVIMAARFTKNAIMANRSVNGPGSEIAYLKDKYGELTDEDIAKVLGDPTKPMIETKVVQPPAVAGKMGKANAAADASNIEPRAVIRNQKEGAPGIKSSDFETYVNFARIDEPEQVKFTIGKMAEAFKGRIDEAKRGVITQEATQKMADDLGMTVPELLERRKGQAFNAEEATAARQLMNASAENLLTVAKKAAGPNAGAVDQYAFRRAMAVHAAIQSEVLGARTETARALAAWKIPVGGGIDKARAIEQMMSTMGGPEASKEMARRLAILAETGASPSAINRFAEKGWGATTHDAIKEIWINGLLSSPKTHVVNIMSNTGVMAQQIYERAVAGGFRELVGGDGVRFSEAIAMAYGMKSSIRDAFRMAAKSLKTGETGYAFNKVDVSHPGAISAEAFDMSKETGMGRAVDFVGHAFDVPGRLLGAEDEFFKTIGYRMEVHAQSLRQASREGLSGNAAWDRMQALVENPPEHIRINAADAAMYNTFTNEMGWFGDTLMKLRDSGGAMNPTVYVIPFIRTPTNIARYTFERTPFAPLVGQWRADIAAGGARADLALARMSTGSAIMLTTMDWTSSGSVSGAGPADPADKEALMRSGWKPYSMKVGDRWYSYNRADPFGALMGFSASINEAVNRGEVDQEDVDEWQEVTAMAIAAVGQTVVNKTYLQGIANVVEVASDPKRYSEGYINNLFSSFVPFTALSSSVENVGDPTQREANSPWQAVEAKIAGLSSKLPPRRDLWGEEIKNESGLGKVYDFMSPIASSKQDIAPIDREIVRLGDAPQRIKKRTVFDGVQVSLKQWPEVYDEYTRLAGNDLKHPAWGMGAKDFLDAVVSGKHPLSEVYNIKSDEARREFITHTISDYRKMAQRQILNDPKFAAFAADVNKVKAAHQQSKMPVFGE